MLMANYTHLSTLNLYLHVASYVAIIHSCRIYALTAFEHLQFLDVMSCSYYLGIMGRNVSDLVVVLYNYSQHRNYT